MTIVDLSTRTALVTGASRGFGRGIATALVEAGAHVIGLARTPAPLEELHTELGQAFTPVMGDATDEALAAALIAQHRPDILVLNAGTTPHTAPLQEQTWDTFRANWEIDTQHAFRWTRAALTQPLTPGSIVISLSSGAALKGSPLSGGYAGAKATIRFISAYAADEATTSGLDLRFVTLLPQLSPATNVGLTGATAYARRQGITLDAYLQNLTATPTPDTIGEHVVHIAAKQDTYPTGTAYLVTGAALHALS